MSYSFDCVVWMVPLEDGLNQKKWHEVADSFYSDEELLPIEVGANNTSFIGLVKNYEIDIRDEVKDALRPIAEDWNKEPAFGELYTYNHYYSINILSEYETI